MKIDLSKFCSTDQRRSDLAAPFSRVGYTWATNGAIMLRVPLRDDVPEIKEAPHAERVWTDAVGVFVPVSPFDIPDGPAIECESCDGRGTKHKCPDCGCTCRQCDGAGVIEEIRAATFGPLLIDCRYVRLMMALPNLEVEVPERTGTRVIFRFDGGEGAVMSLRGMPPERVVADLLTGINP